MPKAPTAREWEEHMVSHWPCRSWCEHCVRGKAKANPHRTVERESEIRIVGIYYMWMTSEEDHGGDRLHRIMSILMSADQKTGWIGACVVPEQGEHWYAVKSLSRKLEELGYRRVVVRSDQEPAIVILKAAVKSELNQAVICEEAPVGESQSLGSVNTQIQILQAR